MGTATLGGQNIATTNQISSMLGYALLVSPAFTGTATLGGKSIATTYLIPCLTGYIMQD